MMAEGQTLARGEIDRIIMMAWETLASFDAIRNQFGLSPGDVIKLMRSEMTANSSAMTGEHLSGETS
jgi:uncharacterized protein (TIGR03643 family)